MDLNQISKPQSPHRPQNRRQWTSFLPGLVLLCLLGLILLQPSPGAAQESGWSQPLNVSNSQTQSTSPSLAADSSGDLHLVWQEEIEPGFSVIMYSLYRQRQWTTPLDILASYTSIGVGSPSLAADQEGYLHIAFLGDGISYSKAFAPLANSARNWSTPINLYPAVNYMGAPDLALGPDGQVYIVFALENSDGSGIYLFSSNDGGVNWEGPDTIYANTSADRQVRDPKITVNEANGIHVAWSESDFPETFPPLGIRYSHNLGGSGWSAPISLADGPYMDIDIATQGQNEVHVVWSGTDTDRFKFHRSSKDGGSTWSGIFRNTDGGGLLGFPSLVFDGRGNLHWFTSLDYFGSVEGENSNGYLYEYVLEESTWSQSTLLMRTPPEVQDQNMSSVAAAISLGNELHVVVQDPRLKADGEWQFEIFHLQRGLDLPANPAQGFSEPTPTTQPIEATPETTVTPAPPAFPMEEQTSERNPWGGILLAVLPSAMLIGVIIILILTRKKI